MLGKVFGVIPIESIDLFRNLSGVELDALRRIVQEKFYPAGSEIFREGDPADGVYIVKSGRVALAGTVGPMQRRVLMEIGPGEIFGETAVLEMRPRSTYAIALENTTVYLLPRGELLHFIERSPGLALVLLQKFSQRMREFNRRYIEEIVQTEQLAIIGRFARAIVHDLKNPLTVISLSAEQVCAPNTTPQQRTEALNRIRKQVEYIRALVEEILEFSSGTGSEMKLAPTNYAQFIAETISELQQQTALKSTRLTLANTPPPITLLIDPQRLRRVFVNLVSNAMDAMREGGVITFRFNLEPDGLVTEIEDTGPGIPPQIMDKLFHALVTHGKEHGTGLGLSICKQIVERHGGQIWARNKPEGGAIFAFKLPMPEKLNPQLRSELQKTSPVKKTN